MHMTQEELAETMCIPKSTISAYENDKVDIKSSVIVELSNHLQISPNDLYGYQENDAYISEVVPLLRQIKDDKVRDMLLVQINALINVYC